MAFVDDKGAQIGVRVERRTPKLLFLREDVGILASLFGAEVTDRLFLLHLRQHLPPETAGRAAAGRDAAGDAGGRPAGPGAGDRPLTAVVTPNG